MSMRSWLHKLSNDERGASAVTYVAMTGIALIVAGLIIAGLSAGRYRLGGAMAGILQRQAISFEDGQGGTANTRAQLYPQVRPVASRPVPTLQSPVVAVPLAAAPYDPTPFVPVATAAVLSAAVVFGVRRFQATLKAQTPYAQMPFGPVAFDMTPYAATVGVPVATAAAAVAAQQLAAQQGQPAPWLKALGSIVVGLVVGVVALAAVAALVYLGAAALAAVGIGAAVTVGTAVLIAGAILAVAFVALDFNSRLEELRRVQGNLGFWDYVKVGGVSLLSITGLPQIWEGISGTRLLSGLPLNETQRWELGLGGLVQLAVFAVGVRAAWPRLRGARPVEPGPGGTTPETPGGTMPETPGGTKPGTSGDPAPNTPTDPVPEAEPGSVQPAPVDPFDAIAQDPTSLFGKSEAEVANMLGDGWTKGHYGKTGTGWKFTKGDKSVFYHEGGRHKGIYYGFSSGKTGKVKIVGPDYVPLPGDKATIIHIPGGQP